MSHQPTCRIISFLLSDKDMAEAVVFDCDGVLADNGSSWLAIHDYFGTENRETLELFLDGKVSEEEFVEADIRKWKSVQPEINKDDIIRCYSGIKLIPGAREVVEELKKRGVFVAIVSSGVDIFVGTIANMLKVDDWAANGFEWDEDNNLIGGIPTRVFSHKKGMMVEKLIQIHEFNPKNVFSVGDSSTDLSMKIGNSNFIGFNPIRERAIQEFEKADVPIIYEKDLREIWPIIFGEKF